MGRARTRVVVAKNRRADAFRSSQRFEQLANAAQVRAAQEHMNLQIGWESSGSSRSGSETATPTTPSDTMISGLGKISVSSLLIQEDDGELHHHHQQNLQSAWVNGSRPTLPSLQTTLGMHLYSSPHGPIRTPRSNYLGHSGQFPSLQYSLQRPSSFSAYQPTNPPSRHAQLIITSKEPSDQDQTFQDRVGNSDRLNQGYLCQAHTPVTFPENDHLSTQLAGVSIHQPSNTHHMEHASSPVAKKGTRSNKAYNEEQTHLMIYFNNKGYKWADVLIEFLKRWPGSPDEEEKSTDAMNSRFYREQVCPRLSPTGEFLWDANGKCIMKRMIKKNQKDDVDGLRWRDYFSLVTKCPRKALEYEWVSAEDKEIAHRILASRQGHELPGASWDSRTLRDERPVEERVTDLNPPGSNEKQMYKLVTAYRRLHHMTPFAVPVDKTRSDVTPLYSSLDTPPGRKMFVGCPHPSWFPPSNVGMGSISNYQLCLKDDHGEAQYARDLQQPSPFASSPSSECLSTGSRRNESESVDSTMYDAMEPTFVEHEANEERR